MTGRLPDTLDNQTVFDEVMNRLNIFKIKILFIQVIPEGMLLVKC